MTTRYIDCNAGTGYNLNSTRNKWQSPLANPLYLPAGSTVEVINSLINLQGITGGSIEIGEEFTETICLQYYMIDTTYLSPTTKVGAPEKDDELRVAVPIERRFNRNLAYGETARQYDGVGVEVQAQCGFTENIMPLVYIYDQTPPGGQPLQNNRLIPFVSQIDIKVEKGIYSISELATIITNQINNTGTSTNPNGGGVIENQKIDGTYKGGLVNNTTNRYIGTQSPSIYNSAGTGLQNPADIDQIRAITKFSPFTKDSAIDTANLDCYAIRPDLNNSLLQQMRNNDVNERQSGDATIQGILLNQEAYALGFIEDNGEPDDPNRNIEYWLFTRGIVAGSMGFDINYDDTLSTYKMEHLHEPRRIPTHDRLGNSLSNPSNECFYQKRVTDELITPLENRDPTDPPTNFPGWREVYSTTSNTKPAGSLRDQLLSSTNNIVGSLTGVMVHNWALATAQKFATKQGIDQGAGNEYPGALEDYQSYYHFSDFFNSVEEAEEVFNNQTIWGLLGFKYNDIQSTDAYSSVRFYDDTPSKLSGLTTFAQADYSAIPFSSTNFNAYAKNAVKPPDGGVFPIDVNFTSIQFFNNLDVNNPAGVLNNNTKAVYTTPSGGFTAPRPVVVGGYEASFYSNAVMIPVQTKGKPITASSLPILTKDGYMLVLSNIVDSFDEANKEQIGLLAQVPKSNLSSQDFINNVSSIIHIISNDKVIKTIDLNITNPDLTDISLNGNSSIMLKITTPIAPQTTIVAESQVEEIEQAITESYQQEMQEVAKMAKGDPQM